jgi:hypothetical protein
VPRTALILTTGVFYCRCDLLLILTEGLSPSGWAWWSPRVLAVVQQCRLPEIETQNQTAMNRYVVVGIARCSLFRSRLYGLLRRLPGSGASAGCWLAR